MDNSIAIFEMCKTIVTNRKRLIKLWDEVEYIQKNGAEPEKTQKYLCPTKDSLTIGQAVTIMLNFPSYISKAKKRLEKMPEGSERDALEQEIAARQQAVDLVKSFREI